MSRIVSASEASARGALRQDGSSLPSAHPAPVAKLPAMVAPPAPPIIDTAPIAQEIGKLAVIVRAALNSQSATLEAISTSHRAPPAPPAECDFEFTVTERDQYGRIVKITAKRMEITNG